MSGLPAGGMAEREAALFAMTFLSSLVVSGLVRGHALASRWLDIPNVRSSHAVPTPRGGGLAIVVSFLASVSVLLAIRPEARALMAIGCAIAVAVVGFLDDRRPVSARGRFLVHTAAALGAVLSLGIIRLPALGLTGVGGSAVSVLLAVFTLTWATNLFNFMDGIDALAATQAIFMAVAGALLNATAGGDLSVTGAFLSLAAAVAGFLPWNWPPARLFMGDVGSGFLGFTLALLAYETCRRGDLPIGAWAILSGTFMVDASVTLIRRMLRGERWLEPHRTHAYQHLARCVGSHRPVTLLYSAINVGWLAPWAWIVMRHPAWSGACVAAALSPLIALALWAGSGRPERAPVAGPV